MKTDIIIYAAIRTPDGTLLESWSQHDYVTHDDANGKLYMIDGGWAYARGSANGDEEDLYKYLDDEDHEYNRENVTWGTRGPKGDQPLTRVAVKDMSANHLQAVLDNVPSMHEWMRVLFNLELTYRHRRPSTEKENVS